MILNASNFFSSNLVTTFFSFPLLTIVLSPYSLTEMMKGMLKKREQYNMLSYCLNRKLPANSQYIALVFSAEVGVFSINKCIYVIPGQKR